MVFIVAHGGPEPGNRSTAFYATFDAPGADTSVKRRVDQRHDDERASPKN
jgi:hypothetical protein